MPPGSGFIIAGAVLLVFGVWFGWFGFKSILKSQIGKQVQLVEGTEMRAVWSKLPLAIYDDIYFFNVTNPNDVYKGEPPQLEQIGPYCLDEWMEKVGLIDDEATDSVAFNFKSTFYFNEKRSKGLTGNEEIVMPHFILLGMLLQTARDTPGALAFIDKAIDPIFNGQKSLYLKTTPNQILFEGIYLNCTSKKVAPKAICAVLQAKGAEMGVQKAGDNIYKVSIFGHRNATANKNRLEVLRGKKNFRDVGKVTKFNGKDKLSMWAGDECNTLQGTDSTIFPPFQKREDDLVFFVADLCRSIRLQYNGQKISSRGVHGGRHETTFTILANDSASRCWCPKSGCLDKGALDLSKCVGAPMILTQPHFYDGSEKYLSRVRGLNPNKQDHGIYMDIEPITGAAFDVRMRLQFNMFMYEMKRVHITHNLTSTPILHPLFWIESKVELDDSLLKPIKMLYTVIGVVKVIKWLMVLGAFGLMGYGGYNVFLANKNKVKDVVQNTVRKMDFNGQNSDDKNKMDPYSGSGPNDKIKY
ncbi:hypothetical protein M8J76_004961 [Diaphorina citri]|nr:hypothetical protein M8J76_004961 [Diaphorina citri]